MKTNKSKQQLLGAIAALSIIGAAAEARQVSYDATNVASISGGEYSLTSADDTYAIFTEYWTSLRTITDVTAYAESTDKSAAALYLQVQSSSPQVINISGGSFTASASSGYDSYGIQWNISDALSGTINLSNGVTASGSSALWTNGAVTVTSDDSVNRFSGGLATGTHESPGSFTFASGTYEFSAAGSSDSIDFSKADSVTFNSGTNLIFRDNVTLGNTSFDGSMTFVANSLTDHSATLGASDDFQVGSNATLTLLLDDDFVANAGDFVDLGVGAGKFDNITVVYENGYIVKEEMYTFVNGVVTFLGAVPEPGAYAAIFGIIIAGFVGVRRRK